MAYLAHLRGGGRSIATVTARGHILRALGASLPDGLNEASPSELEGWLGQFGGWTIYTYFECVTLFYAFCARRGLLPRDPTLDMLRPTKPRSEPHPASEAEVARALAMPHPWSTAVLLAAGDGLRRAEICKLDRAHVTEPWMLVHRKGGVTQLLPTHPRVWEVVQGLPPGPIVHHNGREYRPGSLSVRMSVELMQVGLYSVTLHRFRHFFGTYLLLPQDQGGAGASARTAQDLLGHASLATTQLYALVTDRQRRLAVNALPIPYPTGHHQVAA